MYMKGPVVCLRTSLLGPWTTANTAYLASTFKSVTFGAKTASGWVYLTCLENKVNLGYKM